MHLRQLSEPMRSSASDIAHASPDSGPVSSGAHRFEEALMAICRIIETGATPQQYDQVRSKLGVEDNPPQAA